MLMFIKQVLLPQIINLPGICTARDVNNGGMHISALGSFFIVVVIKCCENAENISIWSRHHPWIGTNMIVAVPKR